MPSEDARRALPGVDRVIEELGGPHALRVAAARAAIEEARAAVDAGGEASGFDDVVERARELLDEGAHRELQPVINATGVLIHTNLGRAPLGKAQLDAVARVSSGYSNLEYDLPAGRRGSRYDHARGLLRALTGAEDALVVNNNAAAVLLVLAALCRDKEVAISRGELIEIGGEFRIPEVMAASGARLVEVGTTNRTHIGDYEKAITADTAAILKVHPSNYRVVGFTKSVPARELARLARGRGLLFLHDIGSGLVEPAVDAPWAAGEPRVEDALVDGADVVTFSGDKLLGGPQAGVIVGQAALIARLSKLPLLRALRVDKMTLAALEATLRAYLEGRSGEVPLWAMATASPEDLKGRAEALAATISSRAPAGVKAEAAATSALAGGGSLPGAEIPSWAVALTHPEAGPDALGAALRRGARPVVARVEDDRVLLDLRAVNPGDDEALAELARTALGSVTRRFA